MSNKVESIESMSSAGVVLSDDHLQAMGMIGAIHGDMERRSNPQSVTPQ